MSKLPLTVLYVFFRGAYYLIYYVFGYRKTVVLNNIRQSFPKLSEWEHQQLVKTFYQYLSRMIAESIKNLSISEKALKQRVTVKNPDIMATLFKNNRDVILLSSHFNNWELLITAQNLIFDHQAVGIGMPLTNSFWDKKLNAKRARFGMKVVNSKNYKSVLKESNQTPNATLVLGDQSPSNIDNVYWATFLNQNTPFYFGAEVMANQMDHAVVYAAIHETKPGYYSIELKLITDQPKTTDYGIITRTYISSLENDILQSPSRWLWSHKRWKIKVPENIEQLKAAHRDRFLKKFRS